MRQKLLTAEIKKRLPALYSTEKTPMADKVVVARFFHAYGRGTWYVVEGSVDPTSRTGDMVFFGAVSLGMTDEPEWGYFTLSELESVKGPGGVQGIERDAHFTPARYADVVLVDRATGGF